MNRITAPPIVMLAVGLVIMMTGAYASSFQYARISIENVTRNPENYLQVVRDGMLDIHARRYILTEFAIEGLTLISMSNKNFTCYSAYLRDTFGYNTSIVVRGNDVSCYQEFVGKSALFNLSIGVSYEYHPRHPVPPLDPDYGIYLSANILAEKDGAFDLRYTVAACLVGTVSTSLLGQVSTPLYMGGAVLVVPSVLLFTFQHFQRSVKKRENALCFRWQKVVRSPNTQPFGGGFLSQRCVREEEEVVAWTL